MTRLYIASFDGSSFAVTLVMVWKRLSGLYGCFCKLGGSFLPRYLIRAALFGGYIEALHFLGTPISLLKIPPLPRGGSIDAPSLAFKAKAI